MRASLSLNYKSIIIFGVSLKLNRHLRLYLQISGLKYKLIKKTTLITSA